MPLTAEELRVRLAVAIQVLIGQRLFEREKKAFWMEVSPLEREEFADLRPFVMHTLQQLIGSDASLHGWRDSVWRSGYGREGRFEREVAWLRNRTEKDSADRVLLEQIVAL